MSPRDGAGTACGTRYCGTRLTCIDYGPPLAAYCSLRYLNSAIYRFIYACAKWCQWPIRAWSRQYSMCFPPNFCTLE